MKTILFLIAYPVLSFGGYSAGDVESVKVFDGKVLYCKEDRNVGGRGYYPSNAKAVATEQGISFSFDANSVICTKEGTTYRFQPIGMNESMPDKDLYGKPIVKHIVSNEAVVINGAYRIIAKQTVTNETTQTVRGEFSLDTILNEAQAKDLEMGKIVKVRMEYFQLMGIVVETAEKNIPIGKKSGGNFAFMFDLRLDEKGELQISDIRY